MEPVKLFGIGVDFGTDSVRAALVSYENGDVVTTSSVAYPRWKQGLYCKPEIAQFRQHPLDYQEALLLALSQLLADSDTTQKMQIGSIGVGATGSTIAPVTDQGKPLSLLQPFSDDPSAMFYLWKDHTATQEAARFNILCKESNVDYTKFQGAYSSEWFWAKIAFAGKHSPHIRRKCSHWMELCDWIVHLLTASDVIRYRSQCSAAHKALWNSQFGGLPALSFLEKFDSYAAQVAQAYGPDPEDSTVMTGFLNKEWAAELGLPDDVVVGGSSLDAHAGAVGAGVTEGVLVSVLGTSAVHMTLLPFGEEQTLDTITRFGGLAENSIVPGYWGVESGQAAFGDVLAWFDRMLAPFTIDKTSLLPRLDTLIEKYTVGSEVTSLEWLNGRRYPDGSDNARGACLGINLSTDAATLYGSLTNAILFGLKRIIGGMNQSGLKCTKIIATGGIARKSPVLMQRFASIMNLPILALQEQETCALGAAMYGAVACGKFTSLQNAQKAMAAKNGTMYLPRDEEVTHFAMLYASYLQAATALDALF